MNAAAIRGMRLMATTLEAPPQECERGTIEAVPIPRREAPMGDQIQAQTRRIGADIETLEFGGELILIETSETILPEASLMALEVVPSGAGTDAALAAIVTVS